jgi:hypothetical protein
MPTMNNDGNGSNIYQEIKRLRKEGKLNEALILAKAHLDSHPDDFWIQNELGWCFYYSIKGSQDHNRCINWLREYYKLNLMHKPDILHSRILAISLKLCETWADFGKFVKWWNLDYLRHEDYQQQSFNDKTYISLAEKTHSALCKNAKKFHLNDSDIEWLIPFSTKLLSQSSDQWVPYHHALLLKLAGHPNDEIRQHLFQLVRIKSSEFWAWQHLGDAMDDIDDKLACYCRGYLCKADDKYTSGFHVEFVKLLVLVKNVKAASVILEKLLARKNDLMKDKQKELDNLAASGWYEDNVQFNISAFCNQHQQIADSLLYNELPAALAVVDHINTIKELAWIVWPPDNDARLLFHRWGNRAKELQAGDVLNIKFEKKDVSGQYHILLWNKTERKEIEGFFQIIKGVIIKREKQPFGFLKAKEHKVFVSPNLIESSKLVDGRLCSAWALYSYDKKRGRYGWKAVKIEYTIAAMEN